MRLAIPLVFGISIILGITVGFVVSPLAIPWRLIDGATIIVGALGLIPAAGEAARLIRGNQLQGIAERPRNALISLKLNATSYVEIVQNGARSSPPKAQYAEALHWFERILDIATVAGNDPLPASDDFPSFPHTLTDQWVQHLGQQVQISIQSYVAALQENRRLAKELGIGALEEIAIVSSPFALCVASGLALASAIWSPGT
jgi:hypothetical protein